MNTAALAGVTLFGIVFCGLCVRTFISFVTVREDSKNDKAVVAVAWVMAVALISIGVVLCFAIGYLGSQPS